MVIFYTRDKILFCAVIHVPDLETYNHLPYYYISDYNGYDWRTMVKNKVIGHGNKFWSNNIFGFVKLRVLQLRLDNQMSNSIIIKRIVSGGNNNWL